MVIDSIAAAEAAGIPVIECHRLPKKPHWACDLFVIPVCPVCGGRHTHDAVEGTVTVHCPPPHPRCTFYLIEKAAR